METTILDEFRSVVGDRGLITAQEELRTYECDGLTNFRVVPEAVLLPTSTEQVQGVVRVCYKHRIPFVARGHGTGLSGGALPIARGVVISLARMNRILEVDIPNARMVVEPGVINLDVTARVSSQGFFYAPDPSSQSVCSIGGNVAENSGGAHCLKYGFTTTHVLGLEVVLPDGDVVHIGGRTLDRPGYDLAGVFVGSEGTLGVATKITLRVVKKPEAIQTLLAAFNSTNEAGAAVSGIIAAGMLPAAIEIGRSRDPSSRSGSPCKLSSLWGPPPCRTRWSSSRGRGVDSPGGRHLPLMRRLGNPGSADRNRASTRMEGTQGGIRSNGQNLTKLYRAGRRHSPHRVTPSDERD